MTMQRPASCACDKKLLFSDCGQAFIMYGCRGRSMVALFDPVVRAISGRRWF